MSDERPGRSGLKFAAAAAAIYVAHAFVANRVTDDCYITFRYVRNWVAGFGPVFNPGERVEGYTNFLWTALLALVHRVAPGLDLLHVAQAMALACGIGVILLVAREGRGKAIGRFAPLFLAFNACFVVWSTGGLETTLFALLIVGAATAELGEPESRLGGWRAPLLLALATMTRPDGIVFVPALALFRAWRPRQSERGPLRAPLTDGAALRRAIAGVLLFALIYGPYWIWRWQYYGWPLPNTFYVKVGSGLAQWKRGVEYVLEWAWPNAIAVALLPLLPLATRLADPRVRLHGLFVAAGLFYVVAVGGESLGLFRFIVPLLPSIALLAQEGLGQVAARVRGGAGRALPRAIVGAIVAGSFLLAARPTIAPMLFPGAFHWREPQSGLTFPGDGVAHSYRWFDNYFVDRLAVAARWIDRNAPPDALVASTPAGSIGYHMRQPMLDMLGLNDETIAHRPVANMGSGRAGHEKGDGRYVLSRKPQYVLLDNVAVFERELTDAEVEQRLRLRSELELWADPEFHRDYEKKCVAIGDAELAGIAPENRRLFRFFTFYERRR